MQTESKVDRGLVLNLGRFRSKETARLKISQQPIRQPLNPERLRVGGILAESNLINKVQPVYPAPAKAAGVEGTVDMEVAISKDGVPEEIRVISSPSDDLTQSALEAVRQWRYRPTLLNGAPIEIVTDVIVNYTLAH